MTHQPFLNFHANLCITNHRQPNQLQFIWPQISILQISEHSAEWIMKIERIMQRWVSLNEQKSPVFLRSCITVVFFLFYLRTATTATHSNEPRKEHSANTKIIREKKKLRFCEYTRGLDHRHKSARERVFRWILLTSLYAHSRVAGGSATKNLVCCV